MRRSRLLISTALAVGLAAGAAALGSPALAGDISHPTYVREAVAGWTPHLVQVAGGPTPVAANSITEAGDRMVVGGNFVRVESADRTRQFPRTHLFSFMKGSGEITSFAPALDGAVWSVLASGDSVYVGGTFKTVNGVPRPALAKVDLATGQLDPAFVPPFPNGRITDMEMVDGRLIVSGTFGKRLMALNPATGKDTRYIRNVITGKLAGSDAAQVYKFDVSPDRRHLVAVGNFTTVDGEQRTRAFKLDLSATTAALSPWYYEPLARPCSSTRPNAIAYVLDVDFAPDSSYFALASFGFVPRTTAEIGTALCDSVARFETDVLAPSRPTWINYTGGDSLKSVAVTGAAVYVQGHNRWLDNPFGRDSAGPGAVVRRGGGAVDPVTGMALPWDPNMAAAQGGNHILPTSDGVWFATDGIKWNGQHRLGIRFAPLPPRRP